MSVLEKLGTIDRRVWYFLIFIIVGSLLLNPIGLPITVGDYTKDFYGYVDALEPGDVVIVNFDISSFGWDELKSQTTSVCSHLFSKPGVKVIFMATQDMGPFFIERMITLIGTPDDPANPEYPWYTIEGKKYLVDWISIGWVPGRATGQAALAADFRKQAGDTGWYGKKIDKWFDDAGVQSAADIKMAISFDCEGGAGGFANHWYLEYGTIVLAGEIGVNVPGALPTLDAGLYKAILASTRGAAEYEFISGRPGPAITAMDAFSLVHILLIFTIIIGNISYFGWERRQKR